MEKHAPDECPRCGEIFICKVNTIFQCDCMNIKLSAKQSAYIKTYTELYFGAYGCLCMNCLKALVEEFKENENNEQK